MFIIKYAHNVGFSVIEVCPGLDPMAHYRKLVIEESSLHLIFYGSVVHFLEVAHDHDLPFTLVLAHAPIERPPIPFSAGLGLPNRFWCRLYEERIAVFVGVEQLDEHIPALPEVEVAQASELGVVVLCLLSRWEPLLRLLIQG